jgi:hypothetical protein
MSQLNRRTALAGAAIAASLVVSGCRSVDPPEPTQSIVAVSAFETLGHAQPTAAQKMAVDLAAALDADPRIEARTEGEDSDLPRDYILKGSMYADAEGGRAFVALQLLDARTAKRMWSENYDYRGIGADLIATDIRRHLDVHAADN